MWVNHIGNERMYCDELGLMGLSKMYSRHSVVLTKSKFWSTIDTDAPFNLLELLQECSVRFVYLGHLRFGSLVWKPRNPAVTTSRSIVPSFEIIEEYTLDEVETTKSTDNTSPGSSCKVVTESMPGTVASKQNGDHVNDKSPVETATQVASTSEAEQRIEVKNQTIDSVSVATDIPPGTSDTINSSVIEPMFDNPDDDLFLTQYPWIKTAKICLDKVSPTTINRLCTRKSVGTKTDVQPPVPTHDRRYSARNVKLEPQENLAKTIKQESADQDTGASPEDLIKQAETILERAKWINSRASTPLKRKSHDKLDVGTKVPKTRKPSDDLSVETEDRPPTRKIKCKLCVHKFYSMDELNAHLTKDHGVE